MELEDKDKRTFEDFLTFLQFHPDLKMWEIDPEPILSLPGLQIYPDRRKIYHGQQEIELNTKEFALLCLLVTNKGRVLTYGQMYEKVWKEEPFGNENIAVGSHVRSMRQKLYAAFPRPPFAISCIRALYGLPFFRAILPKPYKWRFFPPFPCRLCSEFATELCSICVSFPFHLYFIHYTTPIYIFSLGKGGDVCQLIPIRG